MPVFGKKSKVREQNPDMHDEFLEKRVSRFNRKREYVQRQRYPMERTSFLWIKEVVFPYLFSKSPSEPSESFFSKRLKEKKQPLVVLDWGCGKGQAIDELAKGQPVHAYGYSVDSYKEWNNSKNTKFIHSTNEDLLRYFKDGSIDIIYSYLAMAHMFSKSIESRKSKRAINHICSLTRKLSKGGILGFDLFSEIGKPLSLELERRLGKNITIHVGRNQIYLTKN